MDSERNVFLCTYVWTFLSPSLSLSASVDGTVIAVLFENAQISLIDTVNHGNVLQSFRLMESLNYSVPFFYEKLRIGKVTANHHYWYNRLIWLPSDLLVVMYSGFLHLFDIKQLQLLWVLKLMSSPGSSACFSSEDQYTTVLSILPGNSELFLLLDPNVKNSSVLPFTGQHAEERFCVSFSFANKKLPPETSILAKWNVKFLVGICGSIWALNEQMEFTSFLDDHNDDDDHISKEPVDDYANSSMVLQSKPHEEQVSHPMIAHNIDIFNRIYSDVNDYKKNGKNDNRYNKALMTSESSVSKNVTMVKLESLNKISTKYHEDQNNRKHSAFSGFHGISSLSLGSTSKIFPVFANTFLLKRNDIGISDTINTVHDDINNDTTGIQTHKLLAEDKLTEIQSEGLSIVKENGIHKGTEFIDTQIIQEFARTYCKFMGS